ncbi:type IX secretion system sortase PorU [Mesonia aquimarina]|uniref:type IX secretion system sortase PorU n=1 Tax=Mesonia aquimarina TaxID=1504967 RepID=UPI000EF5E009|nr:type IX secretion system sortase PorU [Mesonia aquimarina]
MKFLYTIFLLGCFFSVQAQQKTFTIEWGEKPFSENTAIAIPSFSSINIEYDAQEDAIFYHNQWRESGAVLSSELSNITYETISAENLGALDKKNIKNTPDLKMYTSKARQVTYFQIRINPIVRQNGVYKRVKSFSVSYTKGAARDGVVTQSVPSITNSVLATGDWYKFYIEKTGVYKISRSFLSNLGMDVSSINPQRLKIVGHGGNMLPLLNSENDAYDPPETAIKVVGGEDGSFDSQDYILFYAKAVNDEWSEDNESNLNLYAERSYYYISADGNIGRRVMPYTEPTGNATTTITTFDDYQYHEVDEYSIAKTGRRWFGDRFDVENTKEFEFNFDNLVTSEPVEFDVEMVSASEASTSMQVLVNGQDATTLGFSSSNDDVLADSTGASFELNLNTSTINVELNYNNGGNPSSLAYVDYINVRAKRSLQIVNNQQLEFTSDEAALISGVGEYVIQNASSVTEVWDVTNPKNITSVANTANSNFSFKASMGEKRKYIALSSSDFYTPLREAETRIDNLNLKGTIFENAQGQFEDVDYVIVTSELLLQQANRLAQFRRDQDDLNVKVVLVSDIYTEFNSGKQDIGAIRNFVNYVYSNASTANNRLKYLCLFGDASVDYKDRLQGNNNIVPTFEVLNGFSLSPSTTASDDFFGLMDPEEGGIFGKLDIAVGRMLADSPQTAKVLVDKVIAYEDKVSYGSWRNDFVLISDDADIFGDRNLQVQLDNVGDDISENQPFINVKKIHSDAYQQISSSGGFRYPEATEDITQAVEVGACVVNYFGHGGINGLAAERLVTIEGIRSWRNENRYNVFITVTCEFTVFDNPLRLSPGEYNLLNDKGGSVAMVSTVRAIGVTTGANFNEDFAPYLFNYSGGDDSVAESVRKAKNESGGGVRVIFYFGDPAMKLALADPEIKLTHINDVPVNSPQIDTLKALSKIKMTGELVYPNGVKVNNYNGVLSTTIFDKRIDRNTLGNDGTEGSDDELFIMDFTTLGETVFRGQASVKNGEFEFDFVVPKDIKIPVGNGRVSFYSERNQLLQDNRGYNNEILVGGVNENAPEDNKGPEIQLYMNDENFVSGGITNDSPFLLAKLSDENGINTASGIGHDLVAILDGDETNPYVVNDYYETEVDNYTQGNVNYKLRDLEEGLHTLTFKAWDVYNNSSTAEIQFLVAGDDELKITKVLNYPNPFTTYTEFWFNHNRPFEPLEVQVQVFTVTGKVVWTKNQVINTDGFLSREITWDGRDDFGDRIGKGVYVYKLTVKSTLTNKKVEKFEKLVIL